MGDYLDSRESRVEFVYQMNISEGLDEKLAEISARVMFPPTAEIKLINKPYYKELKKRADAYAKATKKLRKATATSRDWEDTTMSAIDDYTSIAQRHSDDLIGSWAEMLRTSLQQDAE